MGRRPPKSVRHQGDGKALCGVIAGVGKYVPETVVSSKAVAERADLWGKLKVPSGAIERLTGVKERRFAVDGEASSDMAARASEVALRQAGVLPEQIDTLIFAAASHDISEPATANIIQDKLGARNAHVMDVKNACNSFLNAMDILDSLIRTGRCKVGLVASGEVLSRCINWEINSLQEFELGFAALTLGDGGGAVVLKAAEDGGRGILSSGFMSDGGAWELATIKAGGTKYMLDGSLPYFISHSAQLSKLALRHVPPLVKAVLEKTGWRMEHVDLAVPHQVTGRIIAKISKVIKLPLDKVMITLDRYGNTAAASIPIALAEAMESGRIGRGSRVMLVGGASGFSAGAITLVL
jgi:3-oxoacyl-(acyl-carrier-protein) synthase III